MKQLETTHFLRFVFALVIMCCVSTGYSQDLAQAKQLCGNLTAANKAMAQQAGYDLDALCGGVSAARADKQVVELEPMVPRNTASSGSYNDPYGQQKFYDERDFYREQDPCLAAKIYADRDQDQDRNAGKDNKVVLIEEEVDSFAAIDCLKPFGYDLFASAPTTFAPATSIPVSSDYLLGPGDTLDILFYGKSNSTFSLEINRDGSVDFPELGPVSLSGLTYAEAKDMLQARIAAQVIGTQVSISMGTLRSMQIFVLGEAFNPGAYTVSSLSTITHALVSSGGVSDIGSLRKIQLKRHGKLITTLDLYDLLLSGDTSRDLRIQSGDVVYVPTVGDAVSVDGEVLRPAIYELKGGESTQDLVRLAGGLSSKAYAKSARLQRISTDGFVSVFDVDLTQKSDQSVSLRGGDHLSVDAVTDYKKDVVSLLGNVRHEGDFAWRKGMRISDVIAENNKLNPDTDMNIALVVRELANGVDIKVLRFNPSKVIADVESGENFRLMPRDHIIVLSAYGDRVAELAPYVAKLKRQARLGQLPKVVNADGTVRFPGTYPLTEGMSVGDLIELSGGLRESAYSQSAEIARIDMSDPSRAESKIVLSSLKKGTSTPLKNFDFVEFRTVPGFRETHTISLEGEFIFPGTYAFDKGETLTSVIQRAGGFTTEAFIGGSVFLREGLREREEQELKRLTESLQDELQSQNLRELNADLDIDQDQMALQEKALSELSSLEALGRLVIPLRAIMNFSAEDVLLRDNDRLILPKFSQEVTVLGEVRRPVSYLFDPELDQAGYIDQSGGLKPRADEQGIYVVKANGKVIKPTRGLFRFRSAAASISPGDTIVVPLDTDDEKMRPMALLAEASQIIYQLSLGAAAINTFNNNP